MEVQFTVSTQIRVSATQSEIFTVSSVTENTSLTAEVLHSDSDSFGETVQFSMAWPYHCTTKLITQNYIIKNY